MHIVLENKEDYYELHIDQEFTNQMEEAIRQVKGVESCINLGQRYCRHIRIGKAFDWESVILRLQAELIKHAI